MKHFKTTPERGDFAYQVLVAPHKVSGPAMHDLRGFFGLNITKGMPFGCVRDDEGEIYAFVRAVNEPGSTPNPTKFIYQSTRLDGKHLRIDPSRMTPRAMTLFPRRWLDGETACWSSLEGEPGEPWLIRAGAEGIRWQEDGLLDLGGPLMGNGMQWYLPGVEWGTFYVSQIFDIAGVCDGRQVKGMMVYDQVYMAEGGAVHFKKDLIVNNHMHVLWWSFATVYQDGSWDVGSFMVGHDNLGYAIFQNDKGETRTTTDIEGSVRHKEGSYFVESARIMLDGQEQWEFRPCPKGEMIDFVGGFPITAQQEGRWRRVGDTREPDRWFGWGESDRRNGTARNVLGADL
ncbi:MAG: hypothetical protein JWP96_2377 [Polaromonas sp.]|nr:hypothetical protein [Polaromonas sp.]